MTVIQNPMWHLGRVTFRRINQAIADAGLRCELVRGCGYFYFAGDDVDSAQESGVYGVYQLSELSVARWVDEARAKCC